MLSVYFAWGGPVGTDSYGYELAFHTQRSDWWKVWKAFNGLNQKLCKDDTKSNEVLLPLLNFPTFSKHPKYSRCLTRTAPPAPPLLPPSGPPPEAPKWKHLSAHLLTKWCDPWHLWHHLLCKLRRGLPEDDDKAGEWSYRTKVFGSAGSAPGFGLWGLMITVLKPTAGATPSGEFPWRPVPSSHADAPDPERFAANHINNWH